MLLLDARESHRSWFGRRRETVALPGTTLHRSESDAVIAFPGPDADLEAVLAHALGRGVREVSCWSLHPDAALGTRLQELGFQDGWEPCWMGLDPRAAGATPDEGVTEEPACTPALPYGSEEHVTRLGGDVHHLVARAGGAIVGHAVVDLAGDIAGLYDMGVAPAARRRGHGRRLVRAAIGVAADAGCRSLTLNATPEGEALYLAAGFRRVGRGMTWWLFPR